MGRKPRNQHVYRLTGKFTAALGIKLKHKWHQRNARAYSICPCDKGLPETVKIKRTVLLFASQCMQCLRCWHCAEVLVCPTCSVDCICLVFDLSWTYSLSFVQTHAHSGRGVTKVSWKNADTLGYNRERRGWRNENWEDRNRTIEDVHKA